MARRKPALAVPAAFMVLLLGLLLCATPVVTARGGQQPQRVTSTDPALRLKGFEQHQALKAASPFKDLKWQWLGPRNISGRSIDVAVVAPKGKSYTIYVATATGGLWKTDNEATTWTPVFDQGPSTTIGDVTIAPSNPNIVWMGTGEANIFRSSQAGIGVYKSNDAGKTWQHMGLADTYTIPRVVIHPTNPDIVYVAASGNEWTSNAERGVYKTIDGGKRWQKVLFVDDKTGAIDLVMEPSDANALYAATWQRVRLKWNDPRISRTMAEAGSTSRSMRARPGSRSTTASRRRGFEAGSGWTSACRNRMSCTRSWTTTKSRASQRRRKSSTRMAFRRAASSGAPRSIARTTRVTPGRR